MQKSVVLHLQRK